MKSLRIQGVHSTYDPARGDAPWASDDTMMQRYLNDFCVPIDRASDPTAIVREHYGNVVELPDSDAVDEAQAATGDDSGA